MVLKKNYYFAQFIVLSSKNKKLQSYFLNCYLIFKFTIIFC